MNLLLDTNVLPEVPRPALDLRVLGWLDAVDEDRVFIGVLRSPNFGVALL